MWQIQGWLVGESNCAVKPSNPTPTHPSCHEDLRLSAHTSHTGGQKVSREADTNRWCCCPAHGNKHCHVESLASSWIKLELVAMQFHVQHKPSASTTRGGPHSYAPGGPSGPSEPGAPGVPALPSLPGSPSSPFLPGMPGEPVVLRSHGCDTTATTIKVRQKRWLRAFSTWLSAADSMHQLAAHTLHDVQCQHLITHPSLPGCPACLGHQGRPALHADP